jgi:O-antigen/teichoic acid export membrane protein
MNLLSRLARDSLSLSIARVGAQVCMVIVTYLLVRRLSLVQFGEYSFIAAAILIGNTFTTFGSDMVLIRDIAAKAVLSHLSPTLVLQIALSCLFILLVFVLSPYLPKQSAESLYALRVYSFALIPLAFFTVFTSALRGVQKMGAYAWLNLTVAALQLVVISLFIPPGAGIVKLASWLLIVQTAAALLAGILCVLYVPDFWLGWHFSMSALSALFLECLPMAAIATLGILNQRITITILSMLGGASLAGSFSAATRTVESARLVHFSALTVIYPAMASADLNKHSHKIFRRAWSLLIVMAVGIMILLFFLAGPLITIFFGMEYVEAISVLKILSLTLIPYSINSFLSVVFLTANAEKRLMPILMVSLVVLLFSNFWLIPHHGVPGAGWSVLVAESMQSGLLLLAWRAGILSPRKGVSRELPDLS